MRGILWQSCKSFRNADSSAVTITMQGKVSMRQIGKVFPDEQRSWDDALTLYQAQLRFYLDYLIECDCKENVLAMIEEEVREQPVPDEFKHRFLVRVLVRHVIQHIRDCKRVPDNQSSNVSASAESSKNLPPLERLVYFLRDMQEYAKRDAALLIGITDIQVDKLLSTARARIDTIEGPSTLKIDAPGWTYFRWRFSGLDRLCR